MLLLTSLMVQRARERERAVRELPAERRWLRLRARRVREKAVLCSALTIGRCKFRS
jgi:hypothetical protein